MEAPKIYLAVNQDGTENKFTHSPARFGNVWAKRFKSKSLILRSGTIEKLIGRKLTWKDEPVEYTWKEEEV